METLVSLAAVFGIAVSQFFLDENGRGGRVEECLPLPAYLRTLRLTRKGLNALLTVAKAMFDGE